MADTIQKTSSTPLPQHQTVTGQQDPLPLNSREQTERTDVKQSQNNGEKDAKAFADYLNQQGITALAKTQQSSVYDPVTDIGDSSVYKGTGQAGPV